MGEEPAQASHLLRRRVWARALLLGALSCPGFAPPAATQDSEFLTVKLGGDQTIREIAQKYLGDPDLWTEILRASELKSITELRPGILLKLPATAISTANKALVDASGQIQIANQAGAQVFAQENIGKAISLHDEALSRRVKSDWGGTRNLATLSFGEATIALEKSQAARDRAAEALVTDRNGQVEGQRPQDLGWRELTLQTTLVEEERVRTLSDSTAQITFRDASRLRLNANSNAVIQKLRYDPLKKSEVAKVSLVEGDFYALLSSPSTRASFNVDVPRVNASIDSGNFWVRNDDDGAKFTNYDDGKVEVTAVGQSVTLGRNEGTIVQSGLALREKMAVLVAPDLSAPRDDLTVFNRGPRLAWNSVPGAVGYWVEIGGDQEFSRMVASRFGLEQAQFESGPLPLTVTSDSNSPSCQAVSSRHLVTVNDPPQAAFTAKLLVAVGEEVVFDGSGSRDPDGAIAGYAWDFGDGNKGEGVTARNRFRAPGAYKVKLTVKDNAALANSSSTVEQTVRVNAAPIANAGPARVGAPGQPLEFDGTLSTDSDGSIAEYFWDFGDEQTATGKAARHAFANPGVYAVRLRVKDNSGHAAAFGFHEASVVINHPPSANAGPNILAGPGDEVKLSGARSFDPDGKITNYRWEFSDNAEPLQGAEVTRRFEKPGIYKAKLTVTDDSGAINASRSAETQIAVNHAPIAHAGENVETNQLTVSFDAAKSTDADGDTLIYSWNFGDGSVASGVQAIHTYKQGGIYPVVLTVHDGNGLHNSTSQAAIAVRIDRAPIAVAGENQVACTGDTLVFDGGKSKDPEGGILRYLWEFGEGTKSEIVNPTMSYRKGGLYPVTLTVRDDSGMASNIHSDRIAVQIDQGPVATASPREVLACANSEVSFDGSKSTDVDGVVNSFRWDFGDGNFDGGERATHIYRRPGDYRAFLTIQGEKVGNCSNTSTDEVPVKIIAGPVAAIIAPSAVPITEAAKFNGASSSFSDGKVTGWRWDFGDGSSGSGARFVQGQVDGQRQCVTAEFEHDDRAHREGECAAGAGDFRAGRRVRE